jgi:hypothetical protein
VHLIFILNAAGIQVFVVGIGHNVASTELRTIASDPDSGHLFTVETYKELPSIIEKLTTLTCDGNKRFIFRIRVVNIKTFLI